MGVRRTGRFQKRAGVESDHRVPGEEVEHRLLPDLLIVGGRWLVRRECGERRDGFEAVDAPRAQDGDVRGGRLLREIHRVLVGAGRQLAHRAGESATAAAARRAGLPFVVSTLGAFVICAGASARRPGCWS
ncbi:hypothetical protein SALBM311S_01118 [Streptomyces alboniger]